jgi:acyl-CoA synthetase (AMP-forming)/AMP-acid ligase II
MEPALGHDMFTIPANVDNYARSRPNDIAMVDIHESLTWREVGERVDQLARAFVAHGLKKDDVVGLITGGEIWPYIVILAIMKAGGVVAPFSALLRPEDVETLIRDCGAKFLFLGHGKSAIGDALADLLGDDMPTRVTQETTQNPEVRSAAEFVASADLESVLLPAIHPDDRCNIIYSSGTTGLPKGIVQTHLIRAMGSMCLGPALDISSTSRYLLAIPPHTNVTWVGFLATIASGSGFYAMGAFDLNHFFDIMRDYRPTGAFLVPVQIQAILEHPLAEQADFSCFVNILSGGAPLPESTKRLVDRYLPHCFNELWGLTEGVTVLSGGPSAELIYA